MKFAGLIASVIYFWNNVRLDLEPSLYALFQTIGTSGVTYMCIVAFFMRHKITALLGTLSTIYDTRKTNYIFIVKFLWVIKVAF